LNYLIVVFNQPLVSIKNPHTFRMNPCSATNDEERRLFEYFIVAGLENADEAEELVPLAHECGNKNTEQVAPITDL
jgi:hypothetical protein